MRRLVRNWAVAAMCSLGLVVNVYGQQEGDTVVCIKDIAVLKAGDTIVDTVGLGFDLRVRAVKDGWYWVDNGKPGWINSKDVILLDQAPAYLTERIRENPGNSYYLGARAFVYKAQGKFDLAISDLSQAISILPTDPGLYGNRANLYWLKGDEDAAIRDHTVAISLRLQGTDHRQTAIAYNNRGNSYKSLKDFPSALSDYTVALRLDPDYLAARRNRASVYDLQHDYSAAISEYETVRARDKRDIWAYNSLAWIRATCPDPKFRNGVEAVRLANNACRTTDWKDPNCIDTLAAAFAECRDFRNAEKYQRMAIDLLKNKDEVGDFEVRLNLYLAERPYRFPGKFAGYQVGDEAVVLGSDVPLQHPKLKLPTLARGTRFPVAQVNGELVAVRVDGELGWLHQREIIPAHEVIDKMTELLKKDCTAQNYLIRAVARQKAGQWKLAVDDYDNALVIEPMNITAINNRAWVLATCPQAEIRNPKQALSDAGRVNELTNGKVAACLGTLAAALAANEEYEAAIKVQSEAVKLLKDEDELKVARKALDLYRAGLPLRDSLASR